MYSNPYNTPRVILAPVLDEMQATDSNLEPPMVRVRASNSAHFYIDSANDANGEMGSFEAGGANQPPLTSRGIKRMAVQDIQMLAALPNVNVNNNRLEVFLEDNDFVPISIVIPTGLYNTFYSVDPADLMDVFLNTLNLIPIVASSTYPFKIVDVQGYYRVETINGYDWRMVKLVRDGVNCRFCFSNDPVSSTFISRGKWLAGIPGISPEPGMTLQDVARRDARTVLPIGPAFLKYSRWYDVFSPLYTEYTKNPSGGNDKGVSSIIARIYNNSIENMFATIHKVGYSDAWTNYERHRQIALLDFRILDEYGDQVSSDTSDFFQIDYPGGEPEYLKYHTTASVNMTFTTEI